MRYIVRTEPVGNEDNEYATPCYYNFEDIGIMMAFIEWVMKFGNSVDVYISQTGDL